MIDRQPQFTMEPDELVAHIRELHETDDEIVSPDLDREIFGRTCVEYDKDIFDPYRWFGSKSPEEHLDRIRARKERFGNEKTWGPGSEMIWTPYDTARQVVRSLDLTADDTFYDLGAGFGRLPIYAAITSEAKCAGIELVEERVAITNEAIARLGLRNIHIDNIDIREADFSDGTAFFMYAPFSQQTFEQVADKIAEVAEDHPIRVAMRGGNTYIEKRTNLVSGGIVEVRRPNRLSSVFQLYVSE